MQPLKGEKVTAEGPRREGELLYSAEPAAVEPVSSNVVVTVGDRDGPGFDDPTQEEWIPGDAAKEGGDNNQDSSSQRNDNNINDDDELEGWRRGCCVIWGVLVCYFIGGAVMIALVYLISALITRLLCCNREGSSRLFLMARVVISPQKYYFKAGQCCRTYSDNGVRLLGRLIWMLLVGWHLTLAHLLLAAAFAPLLLCSIPVSFYHLKLARIALRPFAATIQKKGQFAAAAKQAHIDARTLLV